MLDWIQGASNAIMREPVAFFVGLLIGALAGYLVGVSSRSLST
jgi:hypothetical protein